MSAFAERTYERIERVWIRLSQFAQGFVAICAGLFGVGSLAIAFKFPKEEWWERGEVLPGLLICVGLIAASYPAVAFFERRRQQSALVLEDACRQVAAHIDENCPDLPLRFVGIHIWVVVGPPFSRSLRRGAKFLLHGERRRSGVRWVKGKGVVGLAWDRRMEVIASLDGLQRRARTEQEWLQLPDEKRLGLEWAEFQATRRYKAVYATPLFERQPRGAEPEVLGILAIDVLRPSQYRTLKNATSDSPAFESVTGVCEGALSSDERD